MPKNRPPYGEVRRQAIVVPADGEDTTSLVGFDDVMDLAQRSGVAIYTITLRSPTDSVRDPVAVRKSDFSMKATSRRKRARGRSSRWTSRN